MKPNTDNTPSSKTKKILGLKKQIFIPAVTIIILAMIMTGFLFGDTESIPATGNSNEKISITPATIHSPTDNHEEDTLSGNGYDIEKPFELIPEDMDETGIGTDSRYRILLGRYDYSAEELRTKLTISPGTDFSIEKQSGKNYLLTPRSVRPNQVYSIQFNDPKQGVSYSWAFQTRKSFFVTRTLPRDQATHVPVNTGIEITFSHKVETPPAKYFDIQPKTEGRFEIHKNIVVFVPIKPLQVDTIYTVTIKKGFRYKEGGLELAEDTVFSFQTEPESPLTNDNGPYLRFARAVYNLYPYEIPLISIYTDIDASTPVDFSLYKYDSEEAFQKDLFVEEGRPSWCVYYNREIDYQEKEQVLRMKTTLLHGEDDNRFYAKYIEIPEPLPEGYYIAVINAGNTERQAFVQINGLAAYVGSAENKTIAFVYDSETATPVEGVEISFNNFSIQTGEDGLAVSENVLEKQNDLDHTHYVIKRPGHPNYYSNFETEYSFFNYYDYRYLCSANPINNQYWRYLYTDRDMYLPDDTISLWGMVAGKDDNTSPQKVTVTLSKGGHFESLDGYSVIEEKELILSGSNAFKTDIPFHHLSPGYYSLNVFSDGLLLLAKGIQISKYEKPIYTIDTSINEKKVMYGEKLEFSMKAQFFEGTPVHGMNFNYQIRRLATDSLSGTLKTDACGNATLAFEAIPNTDSWKPYTANVTVINADPEETSVHAYESFTIFPRDTMIQVESETDANEQCMVNISANKIDIEPIRNKDWYTRDDYTGEPADVKVKVDLYETWYTSTQIGTYYDFIHKKTYPKYHYERHERLLETIPVDVADGKGFFTFEKGKDKGYYAMLYCHDGNGRSITQEESLYNAHYHDDSTWAHTDEYAIQSKENKYSVGDDVIVSLHCNDAPCERKKNTKVLYMLFRKGLIDFTLSDEPTFSFPFNEEYIPNLGIMAVYFDGKDMHATFLHEVLFNEEDRFLNIDITPSKREYRPGETASFDIKVTDASGNGRQAEVLLSVVDEAFFALREQSVDILRNLYGQYVSLGYTCGSIPHTNTLEDYVQRSFGGAEGGEGGDGGSELRLDFKDTALFESVITDENGHGQITMTLPDNLTKWRVTYLGLTEDLYAQSGTVNIDVKLPYFINTVFNDVFIVGDKPVMQIRSFGTETIGNEGKAVEYTILIEKDGKLWNSYHVSSTIGERAYVELDMLKEGSYRYTVTGQYGHLNDAVMLPFEVLPGFIEQPRTDYVTLSEKMTFPDTKWPARAYFFNENVKSFWNELLDLAYSHGQRIDMILVRKQANELLQEFFKDSSRQTGEYDTSKYQLSNGGIALLPYDSANPILTAKICSLRDGSFDDDLMKEYFYRILNCSESAFTDITASYWGLACLQEPVLLELDALLQSTGLQLMDKLYIALAYAYIGDLDSADRIYKDITKDRLKEDSYHAYIAPSDERYDSDDILEATSLCALLAWKVDAPQKQKLFEYVGNMRPKDLVTGAIRLTCIKNNLKTLNMKSSFTYELDGKKVNKVIEGQQTFSMFLTPEKLSNIRFSNIRGGIMVATVYTAPLGEISETDSRIRIKRAYYDENNHSVTELDSSGCIQVSLQISFEPTAPTGIYIVEDYLPASLRYVSCGGAGRSLFQSRQSWYLHEISGQKVSFYVYHRNNGPAKQTPTYYARPYNLGAYTADSAAVFHLESNVINYTPRTRITVR